MRNICRNPNIQLNKRCYVYKMTVRQKSKFGNSKFTLTFLAETKVGRYCKNFTTD